MVLGLSSKVLSVSSSLVFLDSGGNETTLFFIILIRLWSVLSSLTGSLMAFAHLPRRPYEKIVATGCECQVTSSRSMENIAVMYRSMKDAPIVHHPQGCVQLRTRLLHENHLFACENGQLFSFAFATG